MKYFLIIIAFLFSFIAQAENEKVAQEEEKHPLRVVLYGESWAEKEVIEITTCAEYRKYLFKGYMVKEQDFLYKGEYLSCSLIYGDEITDKKELKQVRDIIYNNALLNVPLPPSMYGKAPKKILLKLDSEKENVINGAPFGRVWESNEGVYMWISIKRKISDDMYLVWVGVDFSIGTYISFEEFLFDVSTKEYSEFYRSFTPPSN